MKHKICKESIHFYKFIFIQNWLRFFFELLGQLIIFHNKLQKQNSKIHSYEKVILGKKDMQCNACGSFDLVLAQVWKILYKKIIVP
jgi:hypothetical protein